MVETFAGTARLSKACCKIGLRALAVDKTNERPENEASAIFDLTNPGRVKTLKEVLSFERAVLLHGHLAPACSAASRARARPLRNVANPPRPLRSDDIQMA